ncbi:hypothetical protein ACIBPB_21060 [Micromonospora sp. NPDC049836]|uniref:hypothetical protein n=1 Tax=Micromonospora sp. NPDC049836 TaxID=3364274 RepID=UPI0037A3F8FE
MSQPPTGAEGYPPQPPGGTMYGNPYGGQPAPGQYRPAQPDPTLPQPPANPYAPGAAPVPPPGYPQPLSAPPGTTAPMSAPPVSGPGFGPQPMSGPPVSGPGFAPQPMSAPPGAVPPYGAPAAGAGKGRATTLVLALVAGLLFVLGGVMTGLYVNTNGKLHKSEQTVSQRNGTIAANQQEIDKLKADLQSVRDKLSDTEQDLTGTKNDRDEQARQKRVIASCLDKLTTAISAASRGDKAGFDRANKGLDKICDEAENYL